MKLSHKRTVAEAAKLRQWTLQGKTIKRRFRFSDFKAAMRFVNRVAAAAESVNHHPDMKINYNRVDLLLTTHDEGGLTLKDFRLAARINKFIR